MLFIPSRIEAGEAELVDQFSRNFCDSLLRFLPPVIDRSDYFVKMKIPYVPYFSYHEMLAVHEEDRASQADLSEAYERLASTAAGLASNLSPVFAAFRPTREFSQKTPIKAQAPAMPGRLANSPPRKVRIVCRA